jgi:2-desacetyl-2-hydroxyethyl bacteriochlorophyllide A dehydrogenase
MRALVLTGPQGAEVQDVAPPTPTAGQVVVDVHRVGVCGTDIAFFRGSMPYLADGRACYPLRIGHEWAGVVSALGPQVPIAWSGARVTGDTMLGCRSCDRCARGLQHACARRFEVGVLGGWAGAVAEQVVVPVTSLVRLPDTVSDTAGAMVEPGANAARAILAGRVTGGSRVAVIGAGTIGLLATAFALAADADVHVIGRGEAGLANAAALHPAGVFSADEAPRLDYQLVVEASGGLGMPQLAVDLVEPGGTVICIGIASAATEVDTRALVSSDVTVRGHLSGSPAMLATVDAYASGAVDPIPLVAATVPLDRAADVLAGWRPIDAGPGPKVHIDPRM